MVGCTPMVVISAFPYCGGAKLKFEHVGAGLYSHVSYSDHHNHYWRSGEVKKKKKECGMPD